MSAHRQEEQWVGAMTPSRDMQHPSFSLQDTGQRDIIKGGFSEVEYEHRYRVVPGWMRPAASLILKHSHALPPSSRPPWQVRSISHHNWFVFLPKKVLCETKTRSAKGSEKTSLLLRLALSFLLCKAAGTWADILILVPRCWRAVCLH